MVPHFIKLAACKLQATNIVNKVEIRKTAMVVDFATGCREFFCFAGKPRRSTRYGWQWAVTHRETNLQFPPLPRMIGAANRDYLRMLPRTLLKECSILDQRILVHNFAREVAAADVLLPEQTIQEAATKFLASEIVSARTFYNFNILKRAKWAPLWVQYCYLPRSVAVGTMVDYLTEEILHHDKNISTIDLLFQPNRQYGSPFGYASFLRTIGVKSVLDLHPDGGKILACALAGITYTGLPTPLMDRALNQGIVDTLGMDYAPYDSSLKVDLVICDHSLTKYGMEDVKGYTDHVKGSKWRFVGWCPPEHAAALSKLPGNNRPKLVPIQISKAKPKSYLALW